MKSKNVWTSTMIVVAVIFAMAIVFFGLPNASSEANVSSGGTLPHQQRGIVENAKSRIGCIGEMAFVIRNIQPGSPAEQAGMQPGDLVTELNGSQIFSIEDFQGRILQSDPGTVFKVTYLRRNLKTGELEEQRSTVQTKPIESSAERSALHHNSLKVNAANQHCSSGCCAYCHRTLRVCLYGSEFTGAALCTDTSSGCRFSNLCA